MRIVITGATGGLGRNLVTHFLARGAKVTALGRKLDAGRAIEREGARFVPGDLRDADYVNRAIGHHDVVVHAAALAAPWGRWSDFAEANVLGTSHVLEACKRAGIERLIHISTPSIYHSARAREQIREDEPLPPPRTHYAHSKRLAEELVLNSGVPAILLRPRAIFGPHDTALLPRLLRVMRRGLFPLPDYGRALTDVTAVANVVHAVELAIEAPDKYINSIYNITNDEPMTVSHLTRAIAKALSLRVRFVPLPRAPVLGLARGLELVADFVTHREPALTHYSASLLGTTQTLDISRAKRELNYRPIVSIDRALEHFAGWWADARRV